MARITRSDQNRLPHNDEAEEAVIGSLIIDPDAIYAILDTGLQPSHFFNQQLGWIYDAAQSLVTKGQPLDITIIGNRLEELSFGNGTNKLDAIGGRARLIGLMNSTPTSIHARHYAKIVFDNARKRELLSVTATIAEMVGSSNADIDELMSNVSRTLLPAISVEGSRSHVYGTDNTLLQYLANQQARAERLKSNPEEMLIIGLSELDSILGDLLPGYLHVSAARSSVGKTMYMEHIAETNAKRHKRVVFYHLELGHEMMLDRLFARHAAISIHELRNGYNGREIAEAIDCIVPWFHNLTYVHCPGWSAERIAADIQRLTARGECDIAIVDYLQKLALPGNKSGLNAAMLYGLEAETLKIAAETCQIPIVLGSQVSRDYKGRDDKRPHMEDIRNSGEIEEKANQIVILHRPGERDDRARIGSTELLQATVEKNTSGGIGQVDIIHVIGRYMLADVQK